MAGPLDRVHLRRLLGRGLGPALRLLPQVHPPGFAVAHQLGRGPARGGPGGAKAMAALQIHNLKKSFGGLPAINGVSLEVAPGERRLIIGPNGAGKTTLFNLITGDLPTDAGSIALFETELTRLATHRRAHLGLGRTYQIITLFPKDTLEHNIALSLLGLRKLRWN